MQIPKDAPKYGGKPINPDILEDLNEALAEIPELNAKIKQHGWVAQGWQSGTAASQGTHDQGYCIDWATKGMTNAEISSLVHALMKHRFAAAYRPVGYKLGTLANGKPNINKTEHIHAAWIGKANYELLIKSTAPGGPAYLPNLLAKRKH